MDEAGRLFGLVGSLNGPSDEAADKGRFVPVETSSSDVSGTSNEEDALASGSLVSSILAGVHVRLPHKVLNEQA